MDSRCTRWFIPLLLLPLPAAPPYFLLVYLLTLTLHARPWYDSLFLHFPTLFDFFDSFYCIILLTALFISSCYWQPIPTNSPLSNPISADTLLSQFMSDMFYPGNGTLTPSLLSLNGTTVTTFAEAFSLPIATLSFPSDLPTLPTSLLPKLPSSFFQTYPELTLTADLDTPNHELRLDTSPDSPFMIELQKVESPEVMRLLDRCWCDVSGHDGGHRGVERRGKGDRKRRGLWDVFDVSEWELASVARAREEVSRQRKGRLRKIEQDWRDAVDMAKKGEEPEVQVDEEEQEEIMTPGTSNEAMPQVNSTKGEGEGAAQNQWRTRGGLFDNLLPFFSRRKPEEEVFILSDAASSPSSSSSPSHDRGNTAESKSELWPEAEHTYDYAPTESLTSLPLLRREYDLRPYGFAMVIDFGWSNPPRPLE